MPASWTKGGYTALFVLESPEVRFDDVLKATIAQKDTKLTIDKRFLEVCEPHSIEVCGCVPDRPVLVGAAVHGRKIHVQFAEQRPDKSVRLVLRLTGIRKGFRGHRFPSRTRRQFEANERFIRSAYPDE